MTPAQVAHIMALVAQAPHTESGWDRVLLYEQIKAALSQQAEPPTEQPGFVAHNGDVLWLWKNGEDFLAFKHLYPCFSPGGDPMTLGEPFARAEFRASHDRSATPSAPTGKDSLAEKPDERAEFEAAYRLNFGKRWTIPQCQNMFEREGEGYKALRVNDLWTMWQARASKGTP